MTRNSTLGDLSRTFADHHRVNDLAFARRCTFRFGTPIRATIYTWRYRHEGPPGFRVGRHLRFRWNDVQRWITKQLDRAEGDRR